MLNKSYAAKKDIYKFPLRERNIPPLRRLDIELTERCNNNCMHCAINLPENDSAAKKKELSTNEIKKILKEAASLGCMKTLFNGGEPFLREDFEELYIFARKLGIKVIIFTNATLITPSIAALFRRIPPLEKIEVSVYGMKRNSYEATTRTSGSYDAAWRGINLLLENRIPFIVKSALLPSNREEIEEFDAWAATIPGMGKPPRYAMFFDLRWRRDDVNKNELIKKLRVDPEDGMKILARDKERYFKNTRDFCSKFINQPTDGLFLCGAGMGSCCVDAYGILLPCASLKDPDTSYNLKEGSLKDALTEFFPKLRGMKATNPDYLRRCAKCFLKGFCEQCPAKSWIEYGTLDTPVEYFCDVAHASAKFLGLLGENEKAWEVKEWRKRVENFTAREEAVYEKRG